MEKKTASDHRVTDIASSYISNSGKVKLPEDVITSAKHHILDTLAAMVSGSKLKPGKFALKYARSQQGGFNEAQVAGSPIVTSAINAAFANGIMAHADETDDSHGKSRTHPGCAIVPAALAVAEKEEVDGMRFLKGVVAGYDMGCRITRALWEKNLRRKQLLSYTSHSFGGNFGTGAAAASILRLNSEQARFVLSYAGQQASGVRYWLRDPEHIEKAFVFGGMPARNGVTAATLVQLGFTGVRDPFSGKANFFETFSSFSRPELLVEELGSRYEIKFTNIKKFSVGSPIQAALDALLLIIQKKPIGVKDVKKIIARLPDYGAATVNDRDMPDINLQYILSVALIDGDLTFKAAHSFERMKDPAVLELKKKIELAEDPALSKAKIIRQAIVEVIKTDGSILKEHVVNVRGTPENPMTTQEVEKKCRELMTPVLGRNRTDNLINMIWNLEKVKNMREIRPFLAVP